MIYHYHGQRNNGTGYYYTIYVALSVVFLTPSAMYSNVLDFLLGFISVTENAKTDWSNPPGGVTLLGLVGGGGFYMRWTKKQ